MAGSFDHEDKECWYFGAIGRQEATDLLMAEGDCGVFLVRDSTSSVGDYVLCVKEGSKVSHYIINKTQQQDQAQYKIGDNFFKTISELLLFYKIHYLDTTPLIRPANKKVEKVIAKFDFESKEKDDLSFKKGDILTVLFKDEEQWWTARSKEGKIGSIPVPYVQKISMIFSMLTLYFCHYRFRKNKPPMTQTNEESELQETQSSPNTRFSSKSVMHPAFLK